MDLCTLHTHNEP